MKVNALVMGDIGTGKTTSLRTLLPEWEDDAGKVHRGAGLQVGLIAMDPGWEAVLGRQSCKAGLHVHYIPPAKVGWEIMRKYVSLANTMNMDALAKLTDPNRMQYTQFQEVFSTCAHFICDRCGTDLGDVAEWGEDQAVALDTLTPLSNAALQTIVGGKPIKTLPEYMAAMEFIEGFFKLFWGNTNCTAVLTAHIDREVNPLTGLSSITANTLGQKLAPKLVKMPDEIVVSKHERGQYRWSTLEDNVILKHRRLPESDTLAPDFSQLFV